MKKSLIILLIVLLLVNVSAAIAEDSANTAQNTLETKEIGKSFGLDSNLVKLSASKLSDVDVFKMSTQNTLWVESKEDFKLEFFDKDGRVTKSYSGFKNPTIGNNLLVFDKNNELTEGTHFKSNGGKNNEGQKIPLKGYNLKFYNGDHISIPYSPDNPSLTPEIKKLHSGENNPKNFVEILSAEKISKPEKIEGINSVEKPIFSFKTLSEEQTYEENGVKTATVKGTMSFDGDQPRVLLKDSLSVDNINVKGVYDEKSGMPIESGTNLYFDGKKHSGDYASFNLQGQEKSVIISSDTKPTHPFIFDDANPIFDGNGHFSVYPKDNSFIEIKKDSSGVSVNSYGKEFKIEAGDKIISRDSSGDIYSLKRTSFGYIGAYSPDFKLNAYDKDGNLLPEGEMKFGKNAEIRIYDNKKIQSEESNWPRTYIQENPETEIVDNKNIQSEQNNQPGIYIQENAEPSIPDNNIPSGENTPLVSRVRYNPQFTTIEDPLGELPSADFKSDVIKKTFDSSVKITTGDGSIGSGTIIKVDKNIAYILSAQHVAGEGGEASISQIMLNNDPEQIVDGKWIAFDKKNDLGLLKINIPNGYEISSSEIQNSPDKVLDLGKISSFDKASEEFFNNPRYDDVICIGCGDQADGSNPLKLKLGQANRFIRMNFRDRDAIVSYTNVNFGDSGGGLFDSEGKLIGVTIHFLDNNYNDVQKNKLIEHSPVETIREFLSKNGYSSLFKFVLIIVRNQNLLLFFNYLE